MSTLSTSRIWCFDSGRLETALEALYRSRRADSTEAREEAIKEEECIRRFLNSDLAKEHKLIVIPSKDKQATP